jgi:hypothetical protein
MAKRPAKKKSKKADSKPLASRPSLPTTSSESKPLSVSTQEFVRLVASQTRSHKAIAAFTIVLLVAVVVGGYWWSARDAPSATAAEVAPPPPKPEPGQSEAPPASDKAAREALKKAPAPIASLLNGPRHPVASRSGAPAPPLGGDVHVPRFNAYDLARSIASDRRGAVQLCYEHALKRDPHLHGRVTVDLQLKAPHQIGEVRVIDNLKRTSFTQCVQKAMRHLDFPPLGEDLSVEIPFALTSPDL